MGKKLTRDVVIKRCNEVHNFKYTYERAIFQNIRAKFTPTCPIHGDFETTAKRHMRGQGCPECGKEYARTWRKGNYNHFLERVAEKFGDSFSFPYIEEEYENKFSEITTKCNKCGAIQKIQAAFFQGRYVGCEECRKIKKNEDSHPYTIQDIKNLFKDTPYIVDYSNITKKKLGKNDVILFYCQKHGKQSGKIGTLLTHKEDKLLCRLCYSTNIVSINAKSQWMTKEDFFVKEKEKYNNKFSYDIESFVDEITPITFKCNDCGYTFTRTPRKHIQREINETRTGCKECSQRKQSEIKTKTTEEYKQDVVKYYGGDAFDLTNLVYVASDKPVTLKCNECGKYFTIEANSLLQGHGCPRHFRNRSKIEDEIYHYIKDELGLDCDDNNRKVIDGKELDVFIPSKGVAIELDGLYWHNELNLPSDYHLNKTNECYKNNIRLIHIFEDEWLYKKDIVKSILQNILVPSINHRIYARECVVKEIGNDIAYDFLEANHIQGNCYGKKIYGLYHNNQLVSLMSFGNARHFIGHNSGSWELLRFCSLRGYNIIGGASKLLKHFIENVKPKRIITFADKRWSVGDLYNKLGFILYNESRPNYYYVIGDKRRYRYNFRKKILVKKFGCPLEMSEHDFCLLKKWYRIYDCGSLCFEMNFEQE